MGWITKLLGRDSSESVTYRMNCRACETVFEFKGMNTSEAICPECDETERIYRL